MDKETAEEKIMDTVDTVLCDVRYSSLVNEAFDVCDVDKARDILEEVQDLISDLDSHMFELEDAINEYDCGEDCDWEEN